MSTPVTITRRVSMYFASELAQAVADIVQDYGVCAVTESDDNAWVLTAPARYESVADLEARGAAMAHNARMANAEGARRDVGCENKELAVPAVCEGVGGEGGGAA